jgi:DNA polymerase III delta prime subunit
VKRHFNTTGPCIDWMHYLIPPLRRLPEAPGLIAQFGYFVVHAPRQTGKTTTLRALARHLTAAGEHAALHFSCEGGQTVGEDYETAEQLVLSEIRSEASLSLDPELRPPPFPDAPPGARLGVALSAWARTCPRPLVLFFDEIDALQGASLIAVLRQLRAGFTRRPHDFPASVILCGLRDVRDYKAASGGDPARLGTSSPFNIKIASLRLGDFTPDEVRELYAQHSAETGQAFTEEALLRAIEVSGGQPWLVNAVAKEIVEEMAVPPDQAITAAHVDQARERLILARATHLDSLVARLHEPRVKRFIEPILAGTVSAKDESFDDDLRYCRDLGLLAKDNPLRIANPIYHEVIARVLSSAAESDIRVEPKSFVLPDGRLDMARILREFADFWRENGDVLGTALPYHEVAPQLVLMAFLQRVVNGGGFIEREYGIGRGRVDLLIRWPHRDAQGARVQQREALELKVWRDKAKDPLEKGLEQLDGYLDKAGLTTGVLVIFDRREAAEPIEERTRFGEALTPAGRRVTLLRG